MNLKKSVSLKFLNKLENLKCIINSGFILEDKQILLIMRIGMIIKE